MIVEDYLDPVPYIKRKNKIRSSDQEEGYKEEEGQLGLKFKLILQFKSVTYDLNTYDVHL